MAALYPSRARGLVSVNGYNIQNIANALQPADPEKEYRMWYQYYLHGERGRAGLIQNRRAFCRLLWSLWSPTWRVDDDAYARSAVAFDNPDFVDVVVHSYRHRFGLGDGDPRFENIELKLSAMPSITVPTITLEGDADGVSPSGGIEANSKRFTGRHENRVVANAGHNLLQEAPEAFADAILDINAWAVRGRIHAAGVSLDVTGSHVSGAVRAKLCSDGSSPKRQGGRPPKSGQYGNDDL
ncbi:alpha/beta hydrolase family protein [Paraburkholderia fungorum]|uniref:Alpha/beta hydrolase family protein n=1 Tax=Paraburkholderia fungorum TaxID=134537 RepID=A0AAU8SZK8_9BURK|nr:alpha/beta hydrolase family protein [Paraburkholderia fungorum]